MVARPFEIFIGTRANPDVAGPNTKSPSDSNSEPWALQTHPFSFCVTGTPWCGHKRLKAMYLEVPVRAIATGTPFTDPIFAAPPTFANAGTAFRLTDMRPPGSFFTAVFAEAGSSLPPNATTAQTPAMKERREIGSISRPYFSLLYRVTSAVPKAKPSGNEPAGKPNTDAIVAATPGASTKVVPV